MKPDWEKLGDNFADSKTVIIGDVDCTVEKDLCSKYGVRGYPTIKYFTSGSPAEGDDYQGGRSFDELKTFAENNLGPSCGPDNKDLCSPEQLKELEAVEAMSPEDRAAKIAELEKKISDAEEYFKTELEKLQNTYQEISADKDAKVAAAGKEARMYKVVAAARKSAGSKGHDEL